MSCAFDVSPYDGGWCVKIGDTGEVLFFPGRRRAVSEAHDLARAWPGAAEVRIRGRPVEARSFERWPEDLAATVAAPDAIQMTTFRHASGAISRRDHFSSENRRTR